MKRRLFKLALFLLLGVIVNVAVAWCFSLFIELYEDVYYDEIAYERIGFVNWRLNVNIAPGTTFAFSDREYSSFNDPWASRDKDQPTASEIAPHFGGIEQPSVELDKKIDQEIRWIEARGWPMRSLWCEYFPFKETITEPDLGLIGYEGGIMTWLPPRQVYYADAPHVLPYRIIFPGFYVNSLLYSMIACLLWYGPGTIRRFNRRRKGKCIKCGYDQRGDYSSGCPECGKGREAEV